MKKWLALAGAIVALEVMPGPTLSAAHLDALEMRRNWLPIAAIHAFIVAHLWGLIPRKFDPLCLATDKVLRK